VTIIELARCFRRVREVRNKDGSTDNRGARVEGIQTYRGGTKGESWCCDLFWTITDMYFAGVYDKESPVPRTGSCQEVYEWAKKNSLIVEYPSVGCGYLYVNEDDHAHHIGFITGIGPEIGFAGNTSEDGKSSNGTGAFEHMLTVPRARIKYFRIPGA
jgi:hypothetical protein